LEDAGFEVRDVVTHHFGTGFPKSLDVSKAIDKAAGAERKVIAENPNARPNSDNRGEGVYGAGKGSDHSPHITTPATDDARRWEGWGTALKPATEHWILARKLLTGTVATNVLEHGMGALNVDGCRVAHETVAGGNLAQNPHLRNKGIKRGKNVAASSFELGDDALVKVNPAGRWPPNLFLTHALACGEDGCSLGCPVAAIDEQSGDAGTHGGGTLRGIGYKGDADGVRPGPRPDSKGGASRFFPRFRYAAKASSRERSTGLPEGEKNVHPTVKSVELMRWLCRLVSPPGSVVLDPFAGSGSTGVAALAEGLRFVGVEREKDYAAVANARLRAAVRKK
jgi:site-specific DNA-methyltransferase (adenine-specific)